MVTGFKIFGELAAVERFGKHPGERCFARASTAAEEVGVGQAVVAEGIF